MINVQLNYFIRTSYDSLLFLILCMGPYWKLKHFVS